MAKAIFCTSVLLLFSVLATAQSVPTPGPDELKVDYFANVNGSVDQTVRLTNPGTSGGSICASLYVFDAEQEMAECCNCYLSPDGLRTLSVDKDLTSNPLTSVVPSPGILKIVSSETVSGVCPAYPAYVTPTRAVRAWATHLQNNGALTETASQDATLSTTELSRLDRQCYAIKLDGSGHGLCTCGTGD